MSTTATERGRWAETLALAHLRKHGLTLETANFRRRGGEIDLVMRDGDTVVFVEVRYRRSSAYGDGAESIDPRKRARIVATAQRYLQAYPLAAAGPCRFDVVSVSAQGNRQEVRWIPNAFES